MDFWSATVIVRCDHPGDRPLCAAVARAFARESGLSEVASAELATSVAELVSNLVRHAGSGELIVRRVDRPVPALEVEVSDKGP
ncbi:MAG TPA: ATP-binding protein, partial [Polyangiaceae bacterium]|nr:ATP-binding protein [Polyangiaceae bacterium]